MALPIVSCGDVGVVGLLRCWGTGGAEEPSPGSIRRPLITGPTATCDPASRSLEAPALTNSNNCWAREHLKRYCCGPSGPLRPDSKVKNPASSTPYWRRYLKSHDIGSCI